MEIFLIVLLLIVLVFFVVSLIIVYNKLSKYQDRLNNSYKELFNLINIKVLCLNSSLKNKRSELETNINKRLNEFPVLSTKEDIINSSLMLDRELNDLFLYYDSNKIDYKKLKKEIDKINEEFISVKKEYNDNVLRFNNLLKMFPISLISSLFGFNEWQYYRND